jgi:hypothetical protein
MKEYYRVTKEELFDCLIKSYKSGFSGPLDLAENVVNGIIEDDLEKSKDREIEHLGQELWATNTIVNMTGTETVYNNDYLEEYLERNWGE